MDNFEYISLTLLERKALCKFSVGILDSDFGYLSIGEYKALKKLEFIEDLSEHELQSIFDEDSLVDSISCKLNDRGKRFRAYRRHKSIDTWITRGLAIAALAISIFALLKP